MPVHNADVASTFNEIADLLELEEANPFRLNRERRRRGALMPSVCETDLPNGRSKALPDAQCPPFHMESSPWMVRPETR